MTRTARAPALAAVVSALPLLVLLAALLGSTTASLVVVALAVSATLATAPLTNRSLHRRPV